MKFYIAVLEKDCDPHYFERKENAAKYLVEKNDIPNCTLDEASDSAELWAEDGESVGYYYSAVTED